MSRIGKLPIEIPSGVTITVDSDVITVKGAKGELTVPHLSDVTVAMSKMAKQLSPVRMTKKSPKVSMVCSAALLNNAVRGRYQRF
jgi:large subunit ribosomal protein L6